jgi:uncharacterized protein (TIGR03435 family)
MMAIATTSIGLAQSMPSSPVFDVASLRKDVTGSASDVGPTRDGYHAINVPLLRLIAAAYLPTASSDRHFEYDRIVGAPDWARNDSYTLDARIAQPDLAVWQDPKSWETMLRPMMQSLLVDRCKLVVHREIREMTQFALVPTKGGSKLKQASNTDPLELKTSAPRRNRPS